jgi:phosphatidylglycerol:prolipoprotein diacylglycerol transferase
MPGASVPFPYFSVPAFSLALVVGIALSFGLGLRRSGLRFAALLDVSLAAFAGSVAGARVVHVLLNWAYFSENLAEALHPEAGGLDWHGALIGGLLGLALAARWRRLSIRALLESFAPALPLLAFAGWLGCGAAACGYGAEVDTLARYPAFVAVETGDVYGIIAPRYNTQGFGMALAVALLGAYLLLQWRGWLAGRRFWALLGLFSLGMFAIGFWRGDAVPVLAGLRADQWMDTVFVFCGIALTLYNKH